MYRVLLVEDQKSVANTLRAVLEHKHFQVFTADNVADGLAIFAKEDPEVIVTDLRMEPLTGIDLLREVRQKKKDQLVILMTAYEELNSALEALKLGAFDYLAKPFPVTDLVAVIQRGLAYTQASSGSVDLDLIVGAPRMTEDMVIESEPMQKTMKLLLQVAPTHSFVMILGEKGSGKSRIARTLHRLSSGKDKPFNHIACGTLSGPLPALNRAGTTFLGNVDKLNMTQQKELMKELLRITSSGDTSSPPAAPADSPRIISSTDADMEKIIRSAAFDPDLYTVLSERLIEIQPLRDRQPDILPLFLNALKREAEKRQIPVPHCALDVCRVLEWYAWPENADELESVANHAVEASNGGSILMEHLPDNLRQVSEALHKRRQIDLKHEFMYAEALKRFIQEKGKQKFDQLLSSVQADRQKTNASGSDSGSDNSLASRLEKLRAADSATNAEAHRPSR